MIKNIIFDFGDIFINLDKIGAINNALELFHPDFTQWFLNISSTLSLLVGISP